MPLSQHYKSMCKTCGKPLPPTRVYIRYDCSLIWNCISKCKLTPFVRRSFIDFPACRMDRFQSCRWWGWWWYETRLYWLMIDDDMIILLWFCYDPMMILWWSYDDPMMIPWWSYDDPMMTLILWSTKMFRTLKAKCRTDGLDWFS